MSGERGDLDEYTSHPIFWILGFLAILSGIANIAKGAGKAEEKQAHDIRRPHFIKWLTPHITSRPRQLLFLVLYATGLGNQLLVLRWVGIKGLGWIYAVFELWPTHLNWAMQIWYAVSTLFLILMVAGSIFVGLVISGCQLSSVLELVAFEVNSVEQEKGSKG